MKNDTDEKTNNQQGWFAGKQVKPNTLTTINRKRLITITTTDLSLHVLFHKLRWEGGTYSTGPPGRAPANLFIPERVMKPPEKHTRGPSG